MGVLDCLECCADAFVAELDQTCAWQTLSYRGTGKCERVSEFCLAWPLPACALHRAKNRIQNAVLGVEVFKPTVVRHGIVAMRSPSQLRNDAQNISVDEDDSAGGKG
jgi:hypothetical protein